MKLKILSQTLGIGFLFYILWNISVLFISFFIPSPVVDPGETITNYTFFNVTSMILSLILGLVSFMIIKKFKIIEIKIILFYTLSWSFVSLFLLLFIAYMNQTTQVVFGTFFTFIPFFVIALAPFINNIKFGSRI